MAVFIMWVLFFAAHLWSFSLIGVLFSFSVGECFCHASAAKKVAAIFVILLPLPLLMARGSTSLVTLHSGPPPTALMERTASLRHRRERKCY